MSGNYRIIVELNGNDIREIQSIIAANQGKIHQRISLISALVAEVPFQAIQALAKSNQVKKIWEDSQTRICEN